MVSFTSQGLILPDPPTIVYENIIVDCFLRDANINLRGGTGPVTEVLTGGPNGNGYLEWDMASPNTTSPIQFFVHNTNDTRLPVKPNTTYNVSGWWYTSVVGGIQRFDLSWYDAAGLFINNSIGSDVGLLTASEFQRKDQTYVSPPNAAFVSLGFTWSGIYTVLRTMRMADIQMTEGAALQPFSQFPVTLDDGDLVDVNQLNANLDRIADLAVGGQPLLSTDRPDFFSIDDATGRLIYETDTQGTYVRRNGNSFGAVGIGNVGANWRAVIPGTWRDWPNDNIWSSWLSGNNNTRRARIMPLGRLCFVHMEAVIGAGGSVSGNIGILTGLPFNTDMSSEAGYPLDGLDTGPWPVGDAMAIIGGSTYFGRIVQNSSSVVVRNIPTNNTSASNVWGATAPATWAVGDGITLDFCYYTT